MQTPPGEGGVRECFVPRDGYVFLGADYDTAELRSLAQVCLDWFGVSSLASEFSRGEDPHLNLGADLLGISREEGLRRYKDGDKEIKNYRRYSKPANLGFPGGLGAKNYVGYAKGFGVTLTVEQSQRTREGWFRARPEMRDYFAKINAMLGSYGDGRVTQVRSGRIRGDVGFTNAANGMFQGLTADGAKEALWLVAKACYLDEGSPMYGARIVIFMHDEIILEVRREKAHAAAQELRRLMIQGMKVFVPDVPVECKPVLMLRWYKGAEPVFVNEVLVPGKPVEEGNTVKWVADVGKG
jgi:DNA polymerase-1